MAIEKTLNTRLKLRYDLHENWIEKDPVLLAGELALSAVSVKQDDVVNTVPSVLIKCGDGTHKYSELDYVFAKAADVIAAAKSEDTLRTFVNNVIADAGIASNDAMEALSGRVTAAEGKVTTLEGKMTAVEGKASDNATAIATLQGLVGDTGVAKQITDAIAALNLATTYEAKGEAAKVQTALDTYKTSNDKAVADNKAAIEAEAARADAAEKANANAITAIKDGTTIDSFADVETALAGKETAGAAAQALIDAKAHADGKDEAIAAAKKAGDDAQADVDALELKVGAVTEGKTVVEMIEDAKTAATYDDKAVKADIAALQTKVGESPVADQISTAITNLDLPNTYAAKVHTHVKADITDFAHNHEISEVNGLQDALDGKQASGDYATKAEAQGYADAKDEAIAAAKKAGDDAQTYAEGVDGKLTAEVERAKGVEEGLNGRLTTAEGAITKLNANAETEGSVDYKIAQAVAAIMENPDDTMNSINELVTWVNDHAQDALELNNTVAGHTTAIGALEAKVGESPVADQIANAITAALKVEGVDKYALATDLANAIARIAKNEGDISALQGKMTTAEGEIDTLQEEIVKKANDADLAAIAKTGNVNDLIQAEGDVLIFDCGGAGV